MSAVVRAFSCTLALVLSILTAQAATGNTTDLYVLSVLSYPIDYLIEQPTWVDGADIVPAIHLAVDQINSKPDLLSGYTLHLMESNGACNIKPITYVNMARVITEYKYSQPVVGMIGPACSDSALVVAPLLERYSTISIHLGLDIALGRYPLSFGIIDSALLYAEAMIELVLLNQWTKVGILFRGKDMNYTAASQAFSDRLSQQEGYSAKFSVDLVDTQHSLWVIRNSNTRIIFTFLGPTKSQQFVCLMYLRGLSFPRY